MDREDREIYLKQYAKFAEKSEKELRAILKVGVIFLVAVSAILIKTIMWRL